MEQTVGIENLLERYSTEQVMRAILNFYKCLIDHEQCHGVPINKDIKRQTKTVVQDMQSNRPVETSDHPPCGDCGGTFFLRTGTCHVCQTCGASQGCS